VDKGGNKMKSITDTTQLHNGVKMPWFGLGVYEAKDGEEVKNAVKIALEAGYRSIDTAQIYRNEVGVGEAIAESSIPREDIFITTKVWNKAQGYETTLEAFEKSRKKLQTDYIDLYLIHWPVDGMYKETWRALEKLYREGYVKAIGVSNFHEHHLLDLMKDCEIKPMVNQVECHPRLSQKPLRDFCNMHNIQFEAWSPLMRGEILKEQNILSIAQKYGKTPAQVVIRWDLQSGIVTIPKSVHKNRILENADVFDFELTNNEMSVINNLNENKRVGPDPDNFDF
jgi:methylglyoxal/glyoxal reductase